MKSISLYILTGIIAYSASGCCFGNPNFIVSPSRIERSNLDTAVKELKKVCNSLPKAKCDSERLEIIGHGAGSFKYYPMDINKNGQPMGHNDATAKNITEIMDITLSNKNIQSIEIDAQLPDIDHPLCTSENVNCAFVMHNTPDWAEITKEDQPVAFAYLQRNTLSGTLDYFIKQNYPQKGKRVYLEVKSSNDCALPDNKTPECTNLPIRVANDIKKYLRSGDSSSEKKKWLTITSFSATALQAVHEELGVGLQNEVNYALIAGYDKNGFLNLKARLAQCKGDVPKFTQDIQDFVSKTPWVTRVWFSTKGITNPGDEFQAMVTKRKECFTENGTRCADLRFSVASYDQKLKTFRKRMNNPNSPFVFPLVSIMVDIDD